MRVWVHAGTDVARLNFSHGDAEIHRENVERIRSATKAEDRSVAVQVDLHGPKFWMATIVESGVPVVEGDHVTLTTEDLLGRTREALPVQNENRLALFTAGDQILIDAGLIELRPLSTTGQEVHCQVVFGGTIKSNKGMDLTAIPAEYSPMTEEDH